MYISNSAKNGYCSKGRDSEPKRIIDSGVLQAAREAVSHCTMTVDTVSIRTPHDRTQTIAGAEFPREFLRIRRDVGQVY